MREKSRVLHVISGLETGGAGTALFRLLDGGLAERFDSKVVSLRDLGTVGPKIDSIGVIVSALGIQSAIPSPLSLFELRREVTDFRPDLIQGWMYHGNLAASIAARVSPNNTPIAWNIRHSLYELDAEKLTTRVVIRANKILSGTPKLIIYNSEISRCQHQGFGFNGARGHVIPNGFDTRRPEQSRTDSHSIRNSLGIPQDSIVIGHVARFHPMKNHVGFLRSAVHIGRSEKNVHFILAGNNVDSSNSVLQACVPKDLSERFHFLGDRRDVPILMCAMDILCQSSIWGEAFPNVLGEAMAAGVPCVATDIGDSEIIVGDTGLTVSPRDEKSLIDALKKMLAMNSADRSILGDAARARIKQRYSLPAVVDEYCDRYENLIERA